MAIPKLFFESFLLNENKVYLGQRIGDILTATQDLEQNSEGMGARQVVANATTIVNQIRRIIHGNWSKSEEKYLKGLQKIGVALAKAIDEKDDLDEILPAAGQELEKLLSKMGVPINSLGAEEDPQDEEDDAEQDQLAPPEGQEQPPAAQAPQQPQQQAPPQPPALPS